MLAAPLLVHSINTSRLWISAPLILLFYGVLIVFHFTVNHAKTLKRSRSSLRLFCLCKTLYYCCVWGLQRPAGFFYYFLLLFSVFSGSTKHRPCDWCSHFLVHRAEPLLHLTPYLDWIRSWTWFLSLIFFHLSVVYPQSSSSSFSSCFSCS